MLPITKEKNGTPNQLSTYNVVCEMKSGTRPPLNAVLPATNLGMSANTANMPQLDVVHSPPQNIFATSDYLSSELASNSYTSSTDGFNFTFNPSDYRAITYAHKVCEVITEAEITSILLKIFVTIFVLILCVYLLSLCPPKR